jgi:phosphatidylserine/phosphatidylglycerophosphate/cardiolipin synthase-like enzyme
LPILAEGRNCYLRPSAKESRAIVDARAYYRGFYQAACRARRSILIAGWQFDTNVALLRGQDAEGAAYPVTFLALLDALCRERPELRVHILAWDYSLVYALEREWLQRLKFSFQTSEAIRFEFASHPAFTGSHHQKFAVFDGALAFAGGLDLCDERWDDCDHQSRNPFRVNASGECCRPNHEVQAAVTGDAALALERLFRERWRDAVGEELALEAPSQEGTPAYELDALLSENTYRLRSASVALSRTSFAEPEPVAEARALYLDAIAAAERLIYVETQYFTSRSVAAAFVERFSDPSRSRLQVVVMLPRGADNGKEKFALGPAQSSALEQIEAAARAGHHELRLLCSTPEGDCSDATFIHSKVLIVDDTFLAIGSANFTERSMGLDSELCLAWEADGDAELTSDIRGLRAALLAEHAGRSPVEFLEVEGLVERIDALFEGPGRRLEPCSFERQAASPLRNQIFDPGDPPDPALRTDST